MTDSPHTIGPTRSLAVARRMMLDHGIRHLPVLDGGKIVGLLSERDLLLVESLPGVNPTDVRVEEAMVQNVFTVEPDAPVGEVVETMIERKLGSAVVTRRRTGDRRVHDHRRASRAARAARATVSRTSTLTASHRCEILP